MLIWFVFDAASEDPPRTGIPPATNVPDATRSPLIVGLLAGALACLLGVAVGIIVWCCTRKHSNERVSNDLEQVRHATKLTIAKPRQVVAVKPTKRLVPRRDEHTQAVSALSGERSDRPALGWSDRDGVRDSHPYHREGGGRHGERHGGDRRDGDGEGHRHHRAHRDSGPPAGDALDRAHGNREHSHRHGEHGDHPRGHREHGHDDRGIDEIRPEVRHREGHHRTHVREADADLRVGLLDRGHRTRAERR